VTAAPVLNTVIRYATPADSAAMRAIYNLEVEQSTSSMEWFPLTEADWQGWCEEHTQGGHVLLVAEIDGVIAGFAGYGAFRTRAGYVSTVEDSVFLDVAYRGHGLGKALLTRLLAEARARGVHVMVAAITGENAASIALHEGLGFAEVGHLPQIGHKFGRWLDLYLLQIQLDDRPTPSGG